MTPAAEVRSRRPRRFLPLLIVAVAFFGLVGVSACSSDTKSSDAGAPTDSSDAKSSDAKDGDAGKGGGTVPDGFPDIPLPEFSDAKVIKDGSGKSPGWSVLFTVDETLAADQDTIVTDYAEQLRAAGYEVEGDATDASVAARKGDLEIFFHSSMNGTITIGVI